jgi:predicted O-methyltransferase YrrM
VGTSEHPATPFVEDPLSARLIEIADGTGEGSSVPAQRAHLRTLVAGLAAARPGRPVNVLEIGFNAGLSAVAFLEASPQVRLVSLDLGRHDYVVPCSEHVRSVFGDRFEVVLGDSTRTLPRFAAQQGASWADLVLVDGGHDEDTCRADLLNGRDAAAPGALVVVDDLMPHESWGFWVTKVWDELLREGVLTDPEVWRAEHGALEPMRDRGEPPEACARRWGVARYGSGQAVRSAASSLA